MLRWLGLVGSRARGPRGGSRRAEAWGPRSRHSTPPAVGTLVGYRASAGRKGYVLCEKPMSSLKMKEKFAQPFT